MIQSPGTLSKLLIAALRPEVGGAIQNQMRRLVYEPSTPESSHGPARRDGDVVTLAQFRWPSHGPCVSIGGLSLESCQISTLRVTGQSSLGCPTSSTSDALARARLLFPPLWSALATSQRYHVSHWILSSCHFTRGQCSRQEVDGTILLSGYRHVTSLTRHAISVHRNMHVTQQPRGD